MYTIYAVGDGRFTYEVMQSLALIFDTQTFIGLISVGFIINVLILTIRAIQNQKLELQHLLVSFILYGVLFVPKADVEVADVQEGTIRTVSNVPLGVAAVGEILSTTGFVITDLFEQNFAPISLNHGPYNGVLDDGFMEPLKMLMALRDIPLEGDSYIVNTAENIKRYVAQCTSVGIDNGTIQNSVVEQSENTWEAIKYPIFSSNLIYIDPDTSVTSMLSCSEATTQIDTDINSASSDFMVKVANQINIQNNRAGASGHANIDSAIEQYINVGVDSWKYILNASVHQVYGDGLALAAARKGDVAATIITEEAKNRRNVSYAAESSVFQDIMRPMMSFIETLVYAISPLMAFLFVAGPMGISLGVKYLTLAAWVQLWLPLLAIVKLYIYLVITGQIDEIAAAQVGTLTSIAAQYQYNDLMSSYLGIASMLVSAVPAIALMLIYGGAVTATNLAGRLSSSGFVNSSVAAPSVASASAGKVQAAGVTSQYDAPSSQVVNGRDSVKNPELGGMNVSSALEGSISGGINRAHEIASKSAASASRTFFGSEAITNAIKSGETNSTTSKFVDSEALSTAKNFVDTHTGAAFDKMSEQEQRTIAAGLQGSIGANLPFLKGSAAAKAMEQIAKSQGTEVSTDFKTAMQFLGSSKGENALNNEISNSTSSVTEDDVKDTMSKTEQDQFTQSLETSRKASQTANALSQDKATLTSSAAYDAPNFQYMAERYAAKQAEASGAPAAQGAAAVAQFRSQVGRLIADDSGGTTGVQKAQEFIREHANEGDKRAEAFVTSLGEVGERLDQVSRLNNPFSRTIENGNFTQHSADIEQHGEAALAQQNNINPTAVEENIGAQREGLTTHNEAMRKQDPAAAYVAAAPEFKKQNQEDRVSAVTEMKGRFDEQSSNNQRAEDNMTAAARYVNSFLGQESDGAGNEAMSAIALSSQTSAQGAVYSSIMGSAIEQFRKEGGKTVTDIKENGGEVAGINVEYRDSDSIYSARVSSLGNEGTLNSTLNFDLRDFNEKNSDTMHYQERVDGGGLFGIFDGQEEGTSNVGPLQVSSEKLNQIQEIGLKVQEGLVTPGADVGQIAEQALYQAGFAQDHTPEQIREIAQNIEETAISNYQSTAGYREEAVNRAVLATMQDQGNMNIQSEDIADVMKNPTNENIEALFNGSNRPVYGDGADKEGMMVRLDEFQSLKDQFVESPQTVAAGMNGDTASAGLFASILGEQGLGEQPPKAGTHFENTTPQEAAEMWANNEGLPYDVQQPGRDQAQEGLVTTPQPEPTDFTTGNSYRNDGFSTNPAMAAR